MIFSHISSGKWILLLTFNLSSWFSLVEDVSKVHGAVSRILEFSIVFSKFHQLAYNFKYKLQAKAADKWIDILRLRLQLLYLEKVLQYPLIINQLITEKKWLRNSFRWEIISTWTDMHRILHTQVKCPLNAKNVARHLNVNACRGD